MVRSHKELVVWQKAMDLVEMVYRMSKSFPDIERFGLTSQMTRAVISVPANIAEGNARGTRRDYAHFVSVSRSSLAETETYVLLAVRLRYVTEEAARPILELMQEIGKMLNVLRTRLLN